MYIHQTNEEWALKESIIRPRHDTFNGPNKEGHRSEFAGR